MIFIIQVRVLFFEIIHALKDLSKSNYKHLLITSHNYSNAYENRSILSGEFRPLDIFSCLFRFIKSEVLHLLIYNPINSKGPRKMHLFKKCVALFHLDLIDI